MDSNEALAHLARELTKVINPMFDAYLEMGGELPAMVHTGLPVPAGLKLRGMDVVHDETQPAGYIGLISVADYQRFSGALAGVGHTRLAGNGFNQYKIKHGKLIETGNP